MTDPARDPPPGEVMIDPASMDLSWLPPELAAALDAPVPDVRSVRGLIRDAYNNSTGQTLTEAELATPWGARAVADWLRTDHRGLAFIRRQTHLSQAVYGELSSKFGFLAQRHCDLCGRYESEQPLVKVSIRIAPTSVQVLRATPRLLATYKRALSSALEGRGHNFGSEKLCVQLTFLMAEGRHGDLDNLAKATLDAMQGSLYDNDSQVIHLSLLRLTNRQSEEAITVRLQPSRLDEHHEVIDTTLRIGWAGQEVVEIVIDADGEA